MPRMLARRLLALTAEARTHERELVAIITQCAPKLLQRHGIGPDTAAVPLITGGDNPYRLGSETAFAALCGVNPIEASCFFRRWAQHAPLLQRRQRRRTAR